MSAELVCLNYTMWVSPWLRSPQYVVVEFLGSSHMLNNILVWNRINGYRILNKSVKKFASIPRSPAIEAKREFIEVVIQMLGTDSTLMSTKYPSFQKRHNAMYQRQKLSSRSAGTFYYSNFMSIPVGFDSAITFPPIGANNATRLNRLYNERKEAFSRGVRDSKHTNPSNCFPFFLSGNCNQGIFKRLAASNSLFKASQVSFVNLNCPQQSISTRSNHGSPDLMEPSPRRFVTSEAEDTFEPKSTCPIFLGYHPPNSSKPNNQRFPCSLKNGSNNHRCLISANGTLVKNFSNRPGFPSTATCATKSIRPAQTKKIFAARLFGGKTCLKLSKCAGIVFHIPIYYM